MRRIYLLLLMGLLFGWTVVAQDSATAVSETHSKVQNIPDDLQTEIRRRNNESRASFQAQKYDEALAVTNGSLQLVVARIGKENTFYSSLLNDVGVIYLAKQKYKEAEKTFNEVLEINERLLGKDHLDLTLTLRYLGETGLRSDNPNAARSYYERELQILKANKQVVYNPRLLLASFRDSCRLQVNGEEQQAKNIVETAIETYHRTLGIKLRDSTAQDVQASTAATDEQNQILNGKALVLPKPTYSREAITARAKGLVQVRTLINEQGSVINACAINGDKLLRKSALQAAYQAQFTPLTVDGKAIMVAGLIDYNFVMQ